MCVSSLKVFKLNILIILKVENIRFPLESGRVKGFGYAEFNDIDQLKSALALSNEVNTSYITLNFYNTFLFFNFQQRFVKTIIEYALN